jgi:hypothetical protein
MCHEQPKHHIPRNTQNGRRMTITNRDYLGRIAYPIRDRNGALTGWRFPRCGAYTEAILDRPPLGRAFAGRRATTSGRGHRASASAPARDERVRLAAEAFRLRTQHGLSIRQIATRVGRSPALVGRWLRGIPACGGDANGALLRAVAVLTAQVERRAQIASRWAA